MDGQGGQSNYNYTEEYSAAPSQYPPSEHAQSDAWWSQDYSKRPPRPESVVSGNMTEYSHVRGMWVLTDLDTPSDCPQNTPLLCCTIPLAGSTMAPPSVVPSAHEGQQGSDRVAKMILEALHRDSATSVGPTSFAHSRAPSVGGKMGGAYSGYASTYGGGGMHGKGGQDPDSVSMMGSMFGGNTKMGGYTKLGGDKGGPSYGMLLC